VLGNPGAAKAGVATLELADGLNQFRGRSLWPRLALGMRGVEESVFALPEHAMEAEQSGGLEDHRSAEKPTRAEKASPEPEEKTVKPMEVGGSSARPLQHQELVFKEQILGEEGPNAAGLEELGRPEKQVQE